LAQDLYLFGPDNVQVLQDGINHLFFIAVAFLVLIAFFIEEMRETQSIQLSQDLCQCGPDNLQVLQDGFNHFFFIAAASVVFIAFFIAEMRFDHLHQIKSRHCNALSSPATT